MLDSIDESSTGDDSDDGYISTNYIEEIWDRKHAHPKEERHCRGKS